MVDSKKKGQGPTDDILNLAPQYFLSVLVYSKDRPY